MDLQELITRGRFIFAGAPERLSLYQLVDGRQNTAQLAKRARRHINNVRRDLNRIRDAGLIQPKLDKSGSQVERSDFPIYEKVPLARTIPIYYFRGTSVSKHRPSGENPKVSRTTHERRKSLPLPTEQEILDICKNGEDQQYEFKAAGAGSFLRLTRRLEWGRIPLANAIDDETGQFSVAEVSLKSIFEAKNPAENILIRPYDVITVPRADTIYVIGEVQKSGGFVVNDIAEVTVLQALSMAGGLDKSAKPQDAKIMRRGQGASSRTEIAVNLKKILEGKAEDISMKPEDILFVPTSASKKAGVRALEAALQAGTGVAIWRIP